MTKSLHQTGARVVQYSDAPLRVAGVKYQPKWEWSDDYRKCFRQTYGKPPMNGNGHTNFLDKMGGYLLWLQKARDFTHDEAVAYAEARGLVSPA